MSERLLTVAQVAELAQLHPKTVRRAIRAGRLEAVRPNGPGSNYRVPEGAYGRWLDGQRAPVDPEPATRPHDVTAVLTPVRLRRANKSGTLGRLPVPRGPRSH